MYSSLASFAYPILQLSVLTPVRTKEPALLLTLAPVMWDGQEQSVKQVGIAYLAMCAVVCQ